MIKKSILMAGAVWSLLAVGANAGSDPVDFQLGACAHFSFGWGQVNANCAMIKNAGIVSVRDCCEWAAAEREKGKLELSAGYRNILAEMDHAGLKQFNILCYSNKFYDKNDYPTSPEAIEGFIRYSEAMVKAMSPGRRVVEIWNEWDGGTGMPLEFYGHGDPERYLKLIQAVYPRLKKLDPNVKVISGAFTSAGVVEKLLGMGLMNSCDAVALHTYNYQEIMTPDAPEKWYARMQRLQQRMRDVSHKPNIDFYISA